MNRWILFAITCSYLQHDDSVIAELAALALGGSRLEAALPCVTNALEQPPVLAEQLPAAGNRGAATWRCPRLLAQHSIQPTSELCATTLKF